MDASSILSRSVIFHVSSLQLTSKEPVESDKLSLSRGSLGVRRALDFTAGVGFVDLHPSVLTLDPVLTPFVVT